MDTTIELASRNTAVPTVTESSAPEIDERIERDHEANAQSLAPVDSGIAAWRMLWSAFIFESLLWGFPLSFGVFQNYYSHLEEFSNQRYISVIGTAASGISYMGAPFIIPLLKKYARYRKYMIYIGWVTCLMGILASSYAQSVRVLIFTQGIMYGVGFTVFYYPIISLVNEFWVARRGMAYGILCSSSGVSGSFMPFALEALLNRYGRVVTLRAMTIALAILTGPLIPSLKGRTPISEHSVTSANAVSTRTDTSFIKSSWFWIYTVSNLLQGMAFFFPSLYLPSYASSIGLSSTQGALLLALMSTSQVLGQFSFGYLSDRQDRDSNQDQDQAQNQTQTPSQIQNQNQNQNQSLIHRFIKDKSISLNVLAMISSFISAAAVLGLWGPAHSFGILIIFALIYGFFAAGFTAMWARFGTKVTKGDTIAAFAVFGTLNFGKGIGNILAGPIGDNLLRIGSVLQDVSVGAGTSVGHGSDIDITSDISSYAASKYSGVVLFTGSCMLASAASIAFTYLRGLKPIFGRLFHGDGS